MNRPWQTFAALSVASTLVVQPGIGVAGDDRSAALDARSANEDEEGAKDGAESDGERDSGWSGLPVVAYLPETGFVFGGYLVHHFKAARARASTSTLPLLAAITTKGVLGFEFTPEVFLGRDAQTWLSVDLTARLRPSASYFGLGNDTSLADEEIYRQTLLGLDNQVVWQIAPDFYAGITQRFAWERVDHLDPEGLLAGTHPRGVDGGLVFGLGPVLVYDSRSSNHSPLIGSLIQLAVPVRNYWPWNDYQFTSIELDARHYFQISGEHVIAGQLRWQSVLGPAPFNQLAALGGSTFLRGFVRGRFLDRHALGMELEYRFPIYWRFGGAVFCGAGQVASRLGRLGLDRFHLAGGVGLRFALAPAERIKVRLDVAASPDAVHLYFAPEEAF